jgi:hypothetical protein
MNHIKKNDKLKLYIILASGLFIAVFLGVFKPFEMANVGFFHLLGYGVITIFSCSIYYFLIPRYFLQVDANIDDNIVFKQLPIDFANIITIGTLNFFYSVYIDKTSSLTWQWFFRYQLYTFAIGAMLSFVIYFIVRSIRLKERLEEVEKINELLEHKIAKAKENETLVFESEMKNEKVVVQTNDLICVKAEGNYSQFNYTMNGIVQSKLLRLSLKNVETIIGENQIFSRSHRSYIVNTDKIIKIRSTGNNFQIWVDGLLEPLPASRQNIADLKANFN